MIENEVKQRTVRINEVPVDNSCIQNIIYVTRDILKIKTFLGTTPY